MCLVFDHEPILKDKMEYYLNKRRHLKNEIENTVDASRLQDLQIQSSLIKLLINSGKVSTLRLP